MTVEVESGGRRHTVDVRQVAAGWMVTTDGREQLVDVAGIEGRWSLLVGARSYEVEIESPAAGELLVTVNGAVSQVRIVSPVGPRARWRPGRSAGAAGPRRVVAPMPGRIVKVLVKAGEPVAARQGLVVVEAMKMENELRAPVAGTVIAVRVTEGAAVEANEVLIELE